MTIEKNYDTALSVSHTITIRFDPAANSLVGKIRTINVPEMRRDDAPQWRAAAGHGGRYRAQPSSWSGSLPTHWLKISNDSQHGWFDVPMSLADGRIAKVTFEKGAVGTQLIDDVFTAWRNQTEAPPAKP